MSDFHPEKYLKAANAGTAAHVGISTEQHNYMERKPKQKNSANYHIVNVKPITNIPDLTIRRSIIPTIGDRVYSTHNEYVLTEQIGKGGQDNIYRVNVQGRVAKIFNERNCTRRCFEKIKLMVENRLNFNGICFPLEILKNTRGEFTGYLMQEAKGKELSYLFVPPETFEKNFPDCEKADIVELAITILKKIAYLNSHDVICGDISPKNIMFNSQNEVYFIDTDSYQYDAFPCRVGTPDYLAPELQGKDLSSLMRTQGNENFAVATLLFMLMMQGKQPYAHKGSAQAAKDIKNMIFPYGAGDRPVPEGFLNVQPYGKWRFLWSHLTRKLKYAFIDTFRKDGHNNTESTRFSVYEWLELMNSYRNSLPDMIKEDPESAKIYPERLKRSSKITYLTCKFCKKTKPEDAFYDETTCQTCYTKRFS